MQDSTERDVGRRMGLARGIFQSLIQVWTSKELTKATKMRVYETLVLSALLYNAETWTLKEAEKQRLGVFEMACLRKIEGVTRRDRIRNTDIRERLNRRRGHCRKDSAASFALFRTCHTHEQQQIPEERT